MVLLINACVRPQSRTLPLAREAAQKIDENYEIQNLAEENLRPLLYEDLCRRDECIRKSDFSDEMFRFAKKFREAEEIVIAAPYWDLAFPAVLKCYIEAICVNGLTFYYNEKGIPVSLCKAKRLIYVTTAGGFIPDANCGYDYIRQLCTDFLGIKETVCIKAEGLDIAGADVEEILRAAKEQIRQSV